MISICEKFGEKYSVKYNEKKSICLSFDMTKDRNSYFNDNVNITLNGNQMKWANSVKDLGNYLAYDLSESEEIRHKRATFIWRANGILVKYQDAVLEVKMYLLNSYCCHLYVSQAWCFADKSVGNITTAWNKGVRKIWKLPYDSHRVLLCGLNNGQHIWDYIV